MLSSLDRPMRLPTILSTMPVPLPVVISLLLSVEVI
jgi:hypothetical protein